MPFIPRIAPISRCLWFCLPFLVPAFTASFAAPASAAGVTETCRIRVENRRGGEVSVSADQGRTYSVVGHVLAPADTLVEGFSATEWAVDGSVCATAVHGIRICARHNAAHRGMLFSLVPREYRDLPDSFGGQRSGGAGIYTDIATATGIFRTLAPLVGNPVMVERSGVLNNIHAGYTPHVGDVIVILVQKPEDLPNEIDFADQVGGLVEEVLPGGERRVIARVLHPVVGIGRYDATSYSGVGRINTNHPGVITVSTAREAGVDISDEERGWERRGGFQIVPSVHARDYVNPPESMLIVGPSPSDNRPLEGRFPLFSGAIGLDDVTGDDGESFRVDIRIDHGPWEAMPTFTGVDPHQFSAESLTRYFAHRGHPRPVHEGITDFRIVFPHSDGTEIARQILLATRGVANDNLDLGARDDRAWVVRGNVHINVNLAGANPMLKFIVFLVDGNARGFTDAAAQPYDFQWDTREEPNGRHTVSIQGQDRDGQVISQVFNRVIIANSTD